MVTQPLAFYKNYYALDGITIAVANEIAVE